MSIYLDVHILQSTTVANLNRDDLGTPKTATYGGVLRSRISSQCMKRNIRLRADDTLTRSRRFHLDLAARLRDEHGWGDDTSAMAGIDLVDGLSATRGGGSSEALIFLSNTQADALVAVAAAMGEDAYAKAGQWHAKEAANCDLTDKKERDKFLSACRKYLDGKSKTCVLAHKDHATDLAARDAAVTTGDLGIAVFGRMLAKFPKGRVDAALSVAHPISTHAADVETDFFVGVDDLDTHAGDEGAGSAHMGVNEFTASVYYRYATLNVTELLDVAGGDLDAVAAMAATTVNAIVDAFPTGKSTSTAAANPPAFVYIVVRDDLPINLAIAYEIPVPPNGDGGYLARSIQELADTAAGYRDMGYGDGIRFSGYASLRPVTGDNMDVFGDRLPVRDLVNTAVNAAVTDPA